MSNFYCEECGTAILEGPGGLYVTGCDHYPTQEMVDADIGADECRREKAI